MSDFDDLIRSGASESAALMDDPIEIGGVSVPSVFDEDSMAVGKERYGETEDITATAVVSLSDIDTVPKQNERITRVRTGRRYMITGVSTDAGDCEMQLLREGAKHGA